MLKMHYYLINILAMSQAMYLMVRYPKGRMLITHFGFFVETGYHYCRMKSLQGSGRETRIGIPGEMTWKCAWTEAQREWDFTLDLSGFRLVLGICFRM